MPMDASTENWTLMGWPVFGPPPGEAAGEPAPRCPVLRRFSAGGRLSPLEVALLEQLDTRPHAARTDIVAEGETYARAFVLKE
ncbi:MAG: hypothetical protein ABT940_11205, partial [Alphaproteobacteria bacterium]